MGIPDAELDQIRSDAQELLQSTCQIFARTTAQSGGGGVTESWNPGADIPCRIAPISARERRAAGSRISDESTHVVTLPAYTEIEATSRLQIDGAGGYSVTGIRTREFDEMVRRVEVRELTDEEAAELEVS